MKQYAKLVDLSQFRLREVVAELEALLAAARDGHIQGLAYVVKVSATDHRIGMAGTYRRHPEQALPDVMALKEHLCYPVPLVGTGH